MIEVIKVILKIDGLRFVQGKFTNDYSLNSHMRGMI